MLDKLGATSLSPVGGVAFSDRVLFDNCFNFSYFGTKLMNMVFITHIFKVVVAYVSKEVKEVLDYWRYLDYWRFG